MTKRTSLVDLAGSGANNVPQPPARWLLRFGIPFLIIAAAVILLAVTAWSALVPARTVQAITVAVRPVELQEMPMNMESGSLVQAPGWIEPDPFPTYVAALEQGIVKDILKVEGDTVRRGEVVATLVDENARIQFEKTKEAFALAQAMQTTTNTILEKAIEEQATRVDSIQRVEVANANLQRLEAEAAELDAEVSAANFASAEIQDELARKKGLIEEGAVAEGYIVRLQMRLHAANAKSESIQQQRNAVDSLVKAAQAEVTAAETAHELQIHETIEVEKARADFIASMAEVNRLESERKEASLALARTRIQSPMSGVVIELLTAPGSVVGYGDGPHGSHILHLFDPEKLQVRADIPLADAARVSVGQEARVVVDVLPDVEFKGVVTRFVHKADIQKNTVEAKIQIKDPSPLLKPEMLARVRIMPGTGGKDSDHMMGTMQRVFVPEDAIVRNDGVPSVWVIDGIDRGKGRAALRTINLGDSAAEGWVEVTEGIRPGEKIILDGTQLEDGDYVQMAEGKV